jgi:hypothetical protein
MLKIFNPDFPLDPSSSRRRGSSKKNTQRSGQNLDFDLLCREFLINCIPACAGMTKFRANGKSRFNRSNTIIFAALLTLLSTSFSVFAGQSAPAFPQVPALNLTIKYYDKAMTAEGVLREVPWKNLQGFAQKEYSDFLD